MPRIKQNELAAGSIALTGRSERIRTSDPLVPNEVRYQAALHSVTSEAAYSAVLFPLQDVLSKNARNNKWAMSTSEGDNFMSVVHKWTLII